MLLAFVMDVLRDFIRNANVHTAAKRALQAPTASHLLQDECNAKACVQYSILILVCMSSTHRLHQQWGKVLF
jgi:hypothetical protein